MDTKITPEREKELEAGRVAAIKLWVGLSGGRSRDAIRILRAEGHEDAANEMAAEQAGYDAARRLRLGVRP